MPKPPFVPERTDIQDFYEKCPKCKERQLGTEIDFPENGGTAVIREKCYYCQYKTAWRPINISDGELL